jgi:hypothetical protein
MSSSPPDQPKPSSSLEVMDAAQPARLQPEKPNSGQSEKPQPEQVLGIDRDILEDVLCLFRDYYHLATQANVFLELHTGTSGINTAITNQRDSITHLVTLLRLEEKTRDAQIKQLSALEEHLRRAFIEPYELAVALTEDRLNELFKQYKETVLSTSTMNNLQLAPPAADVIQTQISAINSMRETARISKTENQLNHNWADGAKAYIVAFSDMEALANRLEGYILQAKQIRDHEEQTRLAREEIKKIEETAAKQIHDHAEQTAIQIREAKKSARIAWITMIIGAILSAAIGIAGGYYLSSQSTTNKPPELSIPIRK